MIELMELPYSQDALESVLSKETIKYHYEKHHRGYVDNLNSLIKDTLYEDMSLEEIIRKTASSANPIFNNASQIYNHNFYWNSLHPEKSEMPPDVLNYIDKYFGSVHNLKDQVIALATKHFGSGWVWFCKHEDGSPFVHDTHDAGTPIIDPLVTPLLVIDIWEHAMYIDYRNDKGKYIDELWKIMNWKRLGATPEEQTS